MEIFCYGDKSHIRVHPHIKYFLGAAKTVVTGGKNAKMWYFGLKVLRPDNPLNDLEGQNYIAYSAIRPNKSMHAKSGT